MVLLFGGFFTLRAADEQLLALAQRAQSDFDRVQQTPDPALPDAARCEQSQAAWLTVAPPADLAEIHFRKAYCALAAAAVTHRPEEFLKAAGEFDDSLKAWPDRAAKAPRNRPLEPPPASLRLMGPIAHLQAVSVSSDTPHFDAAELERARREISTALDRPSCSPALLAVASCQSLLSTGRLWLGWITLRQDDLDQAARELSDLPESGWPQWVAGKRAFRNRQYGESAALFSQAVAIWSRPQDPAALLPARLAPRPDRPEALTDWGGAQLLNGDTAAAIGTLDSAVKSAPNPTRALFLRARAEELAGRPEPALADYSLASRTALAHAEDLASGEAHLYRGILLFRRNDFAHAENEFASALNFEIPKALRPDAIAWRHMAAIAEGACITSREPLEQSLAQVSPYFPKTEARALASKCPLTASSVSASAIW